MSAASTPAAAPVAPLDLSRPLRLHVVGVGGPGMSAIAIALAEMGHTVSGSDLREQPVLDRVRAAGVDRPRRSRPGRRRRLRRRHRVDGDPGRQHRAAGGPRARHPDVAPGRDAGLDLRPGPRGRRRRDARQDDDDVDADADPGRGGLAPSFVVGGDVTDAGTGAHWTGGEWLVVEADESDGTHLELPLHATILTNVELDFLEHYGSFEAIVDGFDRYLGADRRPEGRLRRRPVWPPTWRRATAR